ncbi:hypothetical protein ACFVJS_20545 [Nocardioides sp. NPDC057772]|uniref:hypothetical protein n=1 Tax=Nocardioides sp. NPDC057772 TaxID=3346245 RepID=UPI0036709C11
MKKLLIAGACALLALGLPWVASSSADATTCGERHGPWSEIPVADYPRLVAPSPYGEFRDTLAYAVDPVEPQRMYATNSKSVLRSVDGGCSWEAVYRLPPTPTAQTGPQSETAANVHTELDEITTIALPRSKRAGNRVYLGVLARGPLRQNLGTAVLRSDDGGEHWTSLRSGLPVHQELRQLSVAPSDPDRLYAVFIGAAKQPPAALYASFDGGRSWSVRGAFDDLTASLGIRAKVTVDPVDPDVLWAWGDRRNQLYKSTDAGRTWQRNPYVNEPITAFGIHSQPGSQHGQASHLVALESLSSQMIRSEDGGTGWRRSPAPAAQYGDSVAFGHTAAGLALLFSHLPSGVRAPARVFRYEAGRDRFREITPPLPEAERPALYDLTSDAAPQPRLYARAARAIWRYDGPLDPESSRSPADSPEPAFGLQPVPPAPPAPAHLTPTGRHIALGVGESTTVDYTLTLPPRPTSLDLGLLVDSSGSMGPSIRALRTRLQQLVEDLAARGVDLRIGVADYKEYEDVAPYSGTEGGRGAYFRRRDLGPVDEELGQALEALQAMGGGSGEATPALAALYQIATGAGQQVDPDRPTRNDIQPGQQLNFRPGALKVVLHVADAPYREGAPKNPSYPAPTSEKTIDALRAQGILQVGLDIDHGPQSRGINGRSSLLHLARETGALAAAPVDCDNDSQPDISPGEPLVCTVKDSSPTVGNVVEADDVQNMSEALIGVLRAVEDTRTLDLIPTKGAALVAGISPGSTTVDVTTQHVRRYQVTFACTEDVAGSTYPVTLAARLQKRPVATATTQVDCATRTLPGAAQPGTPPAHGSTHEVPPAPAPGHQPAPHAALGPVPPPPPAPIGVPGNAVTVSSVTSAAGSGANAGAHNPLGASAANSQAGTAAAGTRQDERSPQASLALAQAGNTTQSQRNSAHLMTALDNGRHHDAPRTLLAGAALITAAASVIALRTRQRPPAHHLHARIRRR